jgi:SAM-dependent methyltransferase
MRRYRVHSRRRRPRPILLRLVHLSKRLFVKAVRPVTPTLFKHTPFSFDHVYGVDTEGIIHGLRYQPTSIKHFELAVRQIPEPLDAWSFVDIGSGKGRAVLLALAYPFRRVIGIELDPGLHTIARANLGRYRGLRQCREVELLCGDGRKTPLPPGDVVIFFYNSFEGEPFRHLLDHIETSLREAPRRLLLLYSNPVEREAVEGRPAFTRLFEGSSSHDVIWWGNRHLAVYGAGPGLVGP